MNTEQQALLRTILENPDDDAPRLVYADWLEERGDADNTSRAQFIRMQVALAATESDRLNETSPEYQRLRVLANDRWTPQWLREPEWQTWRRGFIQEVMCDITDWVEHMDGLLAEHPIRRVTPLGQVGPDHVTMFEMLKERGIEVDLSHATYSMLLHFALAGMEAALRGMFAPFYQGLYWVGR